MTSQLLEHMTLVTVGDEIADIISDHSLEHIEHAITWYYRPAEGTEVRGVRSGTLVDYILDTISGYVVIYINEERLGPHEANCDDCVY